MQIRPCEEQDIQAVEAFTLKLFPILQHVRPKPDLSTLIDIMTEWRKAHPRPTEGIFLAEEDQQIIGTVYINLAEDSTISWWQQWKIVRSLGFWPGVQAWLSLVRSTSKLAPHEAYGSGIATDPAYRRKGLGADLTTVAEDYARRQGKQIFFCYIAPDNHASIKLVTHQGYYLNSDRPWLARLLRPKVRFLRYEKNLG
jgi:ribosomal protein S18 acetylase RimI-like enzyme